MKTGTTPKWPERLARGRLTQDGDQSAHRRIRAGRGPLMLRANGEEGMMMRLLTFVLAVTGGAAQAHTGHIADLAGHDHWVAGAAIGLAILTGIYGALKGESDQAEEPEDDAIEEEEVPA